MVDEIGHGVKRQGCNLGGIGEAIRFENNNSGGYEMIKTETKLVSEIERKKNEIHDLERRLEQKRNSPKAKRERAVKLAEEFIVKRNMIFRRCGQVTVAVDTNYDLVSEIGSEDIGISRYNPRVPFGRNISRNDKIEMALAGYDALKENPPNEIANYYHF
ncbi:hypothetical protein [Halobacillus ihumii]|uniref:hypothetical protein n=1 Tax=Halobacillus ihumii TaxID=2686092 RepID=UPI0013D65D2F|nr:hypothetical protein [Halobacillus ihumii]